jgi:hypothetical protein
MKKCENIENNLPLYLDNSLSGAEKRAVEEHLKSCPRCTKILVQLSKTQTLVNDLAEVEPPVWFKQKIMARVREEAEKKSFVQKWFYPLRIKIPVQVFATVCIAVLAVYIYRAGEEQIKEIVPSSAPAPVMEVQKNQLPEQKMISSADEVMPKEETILKKGAPREKAREMAADAAKDAGQIVSDVKADKYESAPTAKSVMTAEKADKLESAPSARSGNLPEVQLEKKKESNILGAAMKAGRAPQAQSIIAKTTFLLRAADINSALSDVEKLLIKYEAKNINRQTTQGRVILSAEMKNQKIEDFAARLKTIGQVEEGGMPPGNAEGNISFTIEIVKN